MFEIIGTLMDSASFIWGACVGAVIATLVCVLATFIDHHRNVMVAKERAFEEFDWSEILFANSYWDQRQIMEIILPEV